MTKIPPYEKHRMREFEQQCIMLKELFIVLKKKISSDTRHLFGRISSQGRVDSSLFLNNAFHANGFGATENQTIAFRELTQNMLDAQEIHEELQRLSSKNQNS